VTTLYYIRNIFKVRKIDFIIVFVLPDIGDVPHWCRRPSPWYLDSNLLCVRIWI